MTTREYARILGLCRSVTAMGAPAHLRTERRNLTIRKRKGEVDQVVPQIDPEDLLHCGPTASERAAMLVMALESFGDQDADAVSRVSITHRDIAAGAGLSQAQVSRVLKSLLQKGWLTLEQPRRGSRPAIYGLPEHLWEHCRSGSSEVPHKVKRTDVLGD